MTQEEYAKMPAARAGPRQREQAHPVGACSPRDDDGCGVLCVTWAWSIEKKLNFLQLEYGKRQCPQFFFIPIAHVWRILSKFTGKMCG